MAWTWGTISMSRPRRGAAFAWYCTRARGGVRISADRWPDGGAVRIGHRILSPVSLVGHVNCVVLQPWMPVGRANGSVWRWPKKYQVVGTTTVRGGLDASAMAHVTGGVSPASYAAPACP